MAVMMVGMPRVRAGRLCAAFLVCDGIATLAGLSAHTPFAPAVFCAYAALLVAVAAHAPWRMAFWAPALFSLDNLLSGMAANPIHASDLWIGCLSAALTSGLFALAGVAIAAALRRRAPEPWMRCAGWILLVAVIFL